MKKHILYCILNTVSGSVYFGITSNPIERRYSAHMHRAFTENKKSKLYDAMRSYGPESFSLYSVASFDSREELNDAEIFAIKRGKERGLNLYNMTEGGEGGFVVPEDKIDEWKFKLSKARQGRMPALGMKHTEENKKLFSEVSNKYWDENRKYTAEDIQNFSSFKEANAATGISKTHYYRLKKRVLSND